jgi:uncharacterized protein (TIGR02996 family)
MPQKQYVQTSMFGPAEEVGKTAEVLKTEAAFLEDILADPDDVGPRLIYADWLQEQGRSDGLARAEFIRVQCVLDGMALGDPRRAGLEERERQLLHDHRMEWARGLHRTFPRLEFRRGFVERVTIRAHRFLDRGEALFALAPLRHVKLVNLRPCLPELAATPLLSRLRGLSLNHGQLGSFRTQALLESRHLGRLTALDLGNNAIGIGGLRALLKADLGRLTCLALDNNYIGENNVRALVDSPLMAQLTELNLAGNDLGDRIGDVLGDCPRVEGLTVLDLSRNRHFGIGGFLALLNSPHLRRLTTLRLADCGRGRGRAEEWVGALAPVRPRFLDLSGAPLGDDGARLVASLPHLERLATLRLPFTGIGDEGATALARSPFLGGLTEFDLRNNRLIRETGQRALRDRFGDRVRL